MKSLLKFPTQIQTKNLLLKTIEPTPENSKILFKILESNRNYLESFQGHFEFIKTIEDVSRNLDFHYQNIQKNKGILFGIYKQNKIIGRIRFFNIHDKSCEIGFWLIEKENGHGFMSESLSALEQELFKFGFDKIILDIDDGNKKSENLALRNNYILERKLKDASWAKQVGKCDSLIYIKTK